jgi:hypothetical protein
MQMDEERIQIVVLQSISRICSNLIIHCIIILWISHMCYYYRQVFKFCYIFQPNIIYPYVKIR